MAKRNADVPTPMDPGAKEGGQPTSMLPRARDCYAIKTLVAEVTDLFPETSYETSAPNGLGVNLDVTFDLIDPKSTLPLLLDMLDSDERVSTVISDSRNEAVLVAFRPNARTQDSREPFGLSAAHDILISGEFSETTRMLFGEPS